MTRVVAFDGAPVLGMSGVRAPIMQEESGEYRTGDGRALTAKRLDELVACGHVTRVEPAIPTTGDAVLVYCAARSPLALPSVPGVTWQPLGASFAVAAVLREEAVKALAALVRFNVKCARTAMTYGSPYLARDYARRGLGLVVDLKDSAMAAELYGLILGNTTKGSPKWVAVAREIRTVLNPELARGVLVACGVEPG